MRDTDCVQYKPESLDRWQQGLHRGSYDNAKRTTAHLTPAQRHWKRNAAVCQLQLR